MTLESLMKHADENAKSRVRRTTGYPVKIAKIKHKDKPVSLAIDVYEEPKNCHFKDTTYWLPVYIPEEKRMYLIYSDAKRGYKVSKHTSATIGRIGFSNAELLAALCEVSKDKFMFFNWKWDNECARPYIEIN